MQLNFKNNKKNHFFTLLFRLNYNCLHNIELECLRWINTNLVLNIIK